MNNLVLITSIIDTPNKPLSYTQCRSVFSKQERFEQTKQTINSIKKYIPNSIIVLVEYSLLSKEEENYFLENVNYFINIHDISNEIIKNDLHSEFKARCEGTMTTFALNYIITNNIQFDMFYKISGRYWLTDKFDYNIFKEPISVIHLIDNNIMNAFTCVYKLTKPHLLLWLYFLQNTASVLYNNHGFENIFAIYIQSINNIKFINKVGVSGYVSICGTYIDM
jgi:hypothetical protein